MLHRLSSSPLSRSLGGSSIWWSLRRQKRSLQNGEQPFADRRMKIGLFVNYKNEEKSRTIYLIWTAFLSVGRSCCRRRRRQVWWVPEKQREERDQTHHPKHIHQQWWVLKVFFHICWIRLDWIKRGLLGSSLKNNYWEVKKNRSGEYQ